MAGRPPKNARIGSETKILDVALSLINEGGEKALTYRTLAKEIGVTPMTIAHHVGSRQEMLSKLVARAFEGVGAEAEGNNPEERLRNLLTRYCEQALKHPSLIHCILSDISLIQGELCLLTHQLRHQITLLGKGDPNDAILNLIVDYTHGFVFSVSATHSPHQQYLQMYLDSLDWVIERIKA